MSKNIKMRLLISIDQWDKYAEYWQITCKEIYKNGQWYIHTNKDIANTLINNNMAELIK